MGLGEESAGGGEEDVFDGGGDAGDGAGFVAAFGVGAGGADVHGSVVAVGGGGDEFGQSSPMDRPRMGGGAKAQIPARDLDDEVPF